MEAGALKYTPAFDGLRAIAIVLVLVTHGAKPDLLPGGYGVDIFFVLSGFLITTILWQEWHRVGRIRIGRFYLRRAIRLYPALLAMLAGSFVLAVVLVGDPMRAALETTAAALYLTPVTDVVFGAPLFTGHLWTLAVEEYFYLIWPLLLSGFLLARLNWRTIAVVMISGGIALYAVRVIGSAAFDLAPNLLRVGGIAVGCGIAVMIANSDVRGNARVLSIVGVACFVAAWFVSARWPLNTLNPVFAAGGAVALIFAISGSTRTWAQRILEWPILVYTGKVSYELYLWHVPFLLGAAMMTGLSRNQVWWWAYPLAFAAAAATHAALLPMQQRLRRRVSRDDRVPDGNTVAQS